MVGENLREHKSRRLGAGERNGKICALSHTNPTAQGCNRGGQTVVVFKLAQIKHIGKRKALVVIGGFF